jgi:two-component system, OmpR family, sensor kinase
MISDSIRWQIQAWHGALLILTTSILLFAFWDHEKQQKFSRLDEKLQNALLSALPATQFGLANDSSSQDGRSGWFEPIEEEGIGELLFGDPHLPPHPPHRGPRPEQRNRPEVVRARQFLNTLETSEIYVVAMRGDRREITRTLNAPAIVPPPDETTPEGESKFRTRDGFRELIHFKPKKDVLIVGSGIADLNDTLKSLAAFLVGIGGGVVGLGLVGGWWLASRAIRPLAEISATAERIAEGDLTQRIDTHEAKSELGRLASLLNHTFERLHNTFEQQAQFTADASHELRTPISVIMAQTELALMRERSPEEYREALESCQRSGEQMKTVVNSLLELAQMDAGNLELHLEVVDLAEVIQDAVRYVEPLAEQRQDTVLADLETIYVKIDDLKIQQVMTNLLTNAIKHNPDGCTVQISLTLEDTLALIRVKDDGNGIPSEVLPRVFERFVRADKARSRSEGSSGLGLSIVKAIVEAHDGTIQVSSAENKGTEFIIRLPVAS